MTEHPAASAEAVSPPATENANGKLRRGEDHDRAERDPGAAQVGTGAHRPVRVGVVDPYVEVATLVDDIREEPELEGGPR